MGVRRSFGMAGRIIPTTASTQKELIFRSKCLFRGAVVCLQNVPLALLSGMLKRVHHVHYVVEATMSSIRGRSTQTQSRA